MERRPEGTAFALLQDRLLTDYRMVAEAGLRPEALLIEEELDYTV